MVVMGRVTAPFGVNGWIKIHALTAPITNICLYTAWWLYDEHTWHPISVVEAKAHGKSIIARLAGVADRESAARLKGREIGVPREQLPPAEQDEFYWADLLGLNVVNAEGHAFGHVTEIVQTGANDVLVVNGERETLIPFIGAAIKKVDLAARLISVEWGSNY